ncbi:MAG: NAD(P)H-dependent oxidoreductase [Ignavibacteria bacterium]|nr:NAD(P)H-dependent oxidoreductase [Ignavibacteria bacterium]
MNVLIIYAHPDNGSFNHAILERIKNGLVSVRCNYEIIDLYKDNFNPVLVFNSKIKRSDAVNDDVILHYQNLVKKADHLIFIYPVWWYGLPAILKGFFDRVFVSGFAYTNKGGLPQGLLKGKSAWAVYTIDSPSWFVRFFRNSMEWFVIKNAILKYCGIRDVKRLMFAGVKRSKLKERERWLDFLYRKAGSFA